MKSLTCKQMCIESFGQYYRYSDLSTMSGRDILCCAAIMAQGAYVLPGAGILVGLFASGIFVSACL